MDAELTASRLRSEERNERMRNGGRRMADTNGITKDKTGDAADKTKDLTGKVVDQSNEAAKNVGPKVKVAA
jgi:hypothetical protein